MRRQQHFFSPSIARASCERRKWSDYRVSHRPVVEWSRSAQQKVSPFVQTCTRTCLRSQTCCTCIFFLQSLDFRPEMIHQMEINDFSSENKLRITQISHKTIIILLWCLQSLPIISHFHCVCTVSVLLWNISCNDGKFPAPIWTILNCPP